jgi:peptide/nickel transport system substrate-binding protein
MERGQKPLLTSVNAGLKVTRRRLLEGAALLGLAAGDQILLSPADAQTPAAVVVAQSADVDTCDPAKSTGLATVAVLVNVYDTLVRRDATLSLKPGLALSWRAVDPTTWEFKLRQGVKFHNNEAFNADAVKFSFDRMLDPATHWPGAGDLRLLKSTTVVDAYTVRFATAQPWPELPRFFGYYGMIVPPGYLKQNGPDALVRQPVGTGPYRFVSWVRDDHVELQANPDYWGGRPKIGHVFFRVIPTDAPRVAGLLAGSVQLANLLPPQLFSALTTDPKTKLAVGKSLSVFFVIYNMVNIAKDKPLADPRVRQALNYAIDRKSILSSVMHNVGTPVATFCSEVMDAYDPSIPPFPYDPNKARALLREAGYANGFDFSISGTSGTYPGDRDIVLAIAEQLNQVGVRTKVNITEIGVQLSAVLARKLPEDGWFTRFTDFFGIAYIIPLRAFYSPGEWSQWRPGYAPFNQLVEAAQSAPDAAALRDACKRLQAMYKEQAPAISLFTAPNANGLSSDLVWTPRPDLELRMFDALWGR